jgi:hypothetical protein
MVPKDGADAGSSDEHPTILTAVAIAKLLIVCSAPRILHKIMTVFAHPHFTRTLWVID